MLSLYLRLDSLVLTTSHFCSSALSIQAPFHVSPRHRRGSVLSIILFPLNFQTSPLPRWLMDASKMLEKLFLLAGGYILAYRALCDQVSTFLGFPSSPCSSSHRTKVTQVSPLFYLDSLTSGDLLHMGRPEEFLLYPPERFSPVGHFPHISLHCVYTAGFYLWSSLSFSVTYLLFWTLHFLRTEMSTYHSLCSPYMQDDL